jgi:type I restriction enzyme S subunit
MTQEWPKYGLGEVCSFQRGLTYSRKDTVDFSDNVVLRATNIDLDSGSLDFSELKYLREDFEVKENYKLRKGALLICLSSGSKAHLGKVALVDDDYNASFGGFIGQVIPGDRVDSKYLFYNLISAEYKAYIQGLTDGLNINNLKFTDLKAFQINLPPLPEQKRIVAILDQAFEAIYQAQANIERNIENVGELWQSRLDMIFGEGLVDWNSAALKDITDKIGSGATPRGGQKSYKTSGISLIRSLNVYDDGFRKEKLAFIDEEQASKLDNVIVETGDVLLNITGASVARCCNVESDVLPARVNQHVSIIRPMSKVLLSEFLHYSLIAPVNKKKLLGIGEQGATRQAITKAQIQSFRISYPSSLDEQRQITNQLNMLKLQLSMILEKYSERHKATSELRESLLKKAFSGELTEKEVVV